jgi:peptidylprolyl isomerase
VDLAVGNGPTPRPGQAVVVHYTGTLADGTEFDSTHDRGAPFSFQIGMAEVIPQLDEGISTMRAGGKRKLIIPPARGYAEMGRPAKVLPEGAELHFEVELLEIK